VLEYCASLKKELEAQDYVDGKVRVQIDDRDLRGGEKNWQHVKKGVPLRIEVGPKDMAQNAAFVARRDTGTKTSVPRAQLVATIGETLAEIQRNLFERARKLRDDNLCQINDVKQLEAYFTPRSEDKPEIHGGFARVHVADDPAVDAALKDWKVTVRCIPLEGEDEPGTCLFTGKSVARRAILAKAY
jgi:prolyl-tRNA synthetase